MSRTPEGWVRRLYWEDDNGDRLTLAALVYSEIGNVALVSRTENLAHVAAYARQDADYFRGVIDEFGAYCTANDLFALHTYGFPKHSPIQLGKPEPIWSNGGITASKYFPNDVACAIVTSKYDGGKGTEEADIAWIAGPIEDQWEGFDDAA